MGAIRSLWYRFLARMSRHQFEAYVRIELVGSLDGPVRCTERLRDQVIVMTDRSVYVVRQDFTGGFVYSQRVA